MIVPELSVAENIFLGNEPLAGGLYARSQAHRRAGEILDTLVKGSGIRPGIAMRKA